MTSLTSTTTYYCRTTGHFAVFELHELADGSTSLEMSGGKIRQVDKFWYFDGTDRLVRRYFSEVGPCMMGELGPRTDANWTFRSKVEFDSFCEKLVGHTVDELPNAEVEPEFDFDFEKESV